MPTSPTTRVIAHLRRAALLRDGAALGDGELLGGFIDRRDDAALAALVQRHGPMVWGVCRRLLSHHDAEDAFQATFLVLVRKAASVVPREMVGNFLYGVAHQAALQARRAAARRRAREVQVTVMPNTEAVQQDQWAEVQPLLDQELSRLPDNYRAVIVLCDLEGRTRKEVARQLGVPEGTVGGRLARARAMLAKRLTQRGVALSGGALAAVLTQNGASAGVPTAVVSNTIRAASSFAAGQAAATGPVSAKVAALTQGVLQAMMMSKLKAVVAVVLLLGFIVTGATALSGRTAARANQPPAAEAPMKTPEKPQKEAFTAWGKEVNGLQAGLALSDAHAYRPGETVKMEVKLRNVGKAEIKITHGLLREWPPEVTAADGVRMSVYMPIPKGYKVRVTELVLKPGDTITLYKPEVAVESKERARLLGEILVDTPTICVGPGKYKIGYGGMVQSHPKLTTGSVEFEVQGPAKLAAAGEAFTAWGKEVGGLQMGLGFRPGEKRAYHHGEAVTLVVRVRNVGKKEVKFSYFRQFSPNELLPTVTDSEGKQVPIEALVIDIRPHWMEVTLTPGKESDLYELKLDLRPARERSNKSDLTLYGAGKFYFQNERMNGMFSPEQIKLDPNLDKLATGKLELEVKSAPPPAATEGKAETGDRPMSLPDAIKALNKKASNDRIGKDETPVTEQEVIAAIRASERPKDSAVTDKMYDAFKKIAKTGQLPTGTEFEALGGSWDPGTSFVYDVWWIRIMMPKEGGGTYSFVIRERFIRSRTLQEELVRIEKERQYPPVVDGGRLEERIKYLKARIAKTKTK